MYQWYLPTLGEIIQGSESRVIQQTRQQRCFSHVTAATEWYGAIAALNDLLATQIPSTSVSASDKVPSATAIDVTGETSPQPTCPVKVNGECISGLVLSGPFPLINHSALVNQLAQWTFTHKIPFDNDDPPQLPSAEAFTAGMGTSSGDDNDIAFKGSTFLPLRSDDPLAAEPFCLVLTPTFSIAFTLTMDERGNPQCMVTIDPETVWQGWQALRSRLQLTHPTLLAKIEAIAQQFTPRQPDYQLVMDFHQLMLMQVTQIYDMEHSSSQLLHPSPLRTQDRATTKDTCSVTFSKQSTVNGAAADVPATNASSVRYSNKPLNLNRTEQLKLEDIAWEDVVTSDPSSDNKSSSKRVREVSYRAQSFGNEIPQPEISSDVELLKAIAHEVRTPLTTIRTLTRLLLKTKNLGVNVIKRLQQIDRECTQQIDRFSLIFKAVELETATTDGPVGPLATISLEQVVQQNVARWQQQAQQRNLTLDVVLPQSLPNVMSDPTTLDQVLTGLLERMTHTLPAGTLIQLSVVPAGHQIKLQFWARPKHQPVSSSHGASPCVTPTVRNNGSTPIDNPSIFAPSLRAVGQLLMFQPETGNLSLNLDITKNLFRSLGGKLIVRRTPNKGEVLTIFLPLEQSQVEGLSSAVLSDQSFC